MNHWPSCCEACKRCCHFSFFFSFNWSVGRSLGDSVWHPQQCVGFTGSLCRAVISCAVFLHLCKLPPVINNPQETVVTSVSSHTYPPTRRCRCYSVKEEEDLTGDVIIVFTLGLSGVSTFVSSCSGQSSSDGPYVALTLPCGGGINRVKKKQTKKPYRTTCGFSFWHTWCLFKCVLGCRQKNNFFF